MFIKRDIFARFLSRILGNIEGKTVYNIRHSDCSIIYPDGNKVSKTTIGERREGT
jgi:hypothetical protein